MDLDLTVAQESADRWLTRQEKRKEIRSAIRDGRVSDVESPERIQKRLDRLTAAAVARKSPAGGAESVVSRQPARLVETIGLERVLGTADFLGMDFLEMALAVSRFVGRINIRARPGRTEGFGTGFMVSPRLLLTNNHVLRTEKDALYSEVEFDYQYDRYDRLLPMVVYGLEPETFFMTSRELDFTLVAVRESSLNGVELGLYGWNPLIGAEGKSLLGDPLNIVQHPDGEAKQIVLRSNQLVDLLDDFAHYVADTEPGSSGSPVYNDEWEVVCLHHSAVPKKENGSYIAKDGSIWRQGMDPDDLAWVANEGVRVSSIVNHIKKSRLEGEQARLREELLNRQPPDPLEAAAKSKEDGGVAPVTPAGAGAASTTWTIPLRVTVDLGAPSQVPGAPTAPPGAFDGQPTGLAGLDVGPALSAAGPSAPVEEAISIDPDYGNREGYDPDFLGKDDLSVPLPQLSDDMKEAAALNGDAMDGEDEHV
ncbi:MAG: trypsin-like serine peptidase, partial [Rubrobacter sp.]